MQQHDHGQRLAFFLLALALGTANAAYADDTDTIDRSWSISGFGTLGAAHSTEHNADYTNSVLKPNGAGISHAWSTDVDTHVGAQLDVSLNRQWSAVVQVVSQQQLDNSYRPKVEWANIKYQVTPELALRAGRIALPMFLTADYRQVGYAYPWVHPPVESYGFLPFSSSDGVDATLRWNAGRVRNASQVFYGHDDLGLPAPLKAYARGILGASHTSEWDNLSVRMSAIHAEVTTNIGADLFSALNQAGPAGESLSARYAVDHKPATILSIGMNYDPGRWFVMAEAGQTSTHSMLGKTRNAYVSAGWRWHALTPYATYARVRATGATTDPGLALDGLPPQLAAQVAALNGGLNTLLATIPQETSVSAGLRWDVHANIALKLQFDHMKPVDGSRGTLINPTAAFRSDHPFNVTSVTLDFVY
jgi:hypothetical protein